MNRKEFIVTKRKVSKEKVLKKNFSTTRIKNNDETATIKPLAQLKSEKPIKLTSSPSQNLKTMLKSSSNLNIFLLSSKHPLKNLDLKKSNLKSSIKLTKQSKEKPKKVKFEDQVARTQKLVFRNSSKYFRLVSNPPALSPTKELKRSPRCTVDELLKNY